MITISHLNSLALVGLVVVPGESGLPLSPLAKLQPDPELPAEVVVLDGAGEVGVEVVVLEILQDEVLKEAWKSGGWCQVFCTWMRYLLFVSGIWYLI